MTFVLPQHISLYNSGILDSFFTVTIFIVWTLQTIYFGYITCISAMSFWHSTFHQKVDHNFYYIGKTTAGSFLTHRQRIICENVNVWNGRGIFMLLANKQYNFFEIHIVREIQELFYHTVSRHHTLLVSLRHRVMIVILWLRSYPS